MATVYEIKIETCSPWVSYTEDHMKKLFEEFLENVKKEKQGHIFEGTEVEVKRIA